MEYKIGDDLPIGIYRSNDNIKHFAIRVILQKVTPSCLSNNDPFPKQEKNSGELELLPISTGDYSAFSVEHVFSWQQKISNQISTLDHDPATPNVMAKQRCQAILFSDVDSDFSLDKWLRKRPVTYPPNYSYLEKKMSLRYRGKNFIPQTMLQQKISFSEGKPIIHMPTKNAASHQLQSVGQFMSIMVAFNTFDSADEKDERELCFLHMDANGCLTVFPDFSTSDVPYTIQNNKSETFEYFLEYASRNIHRLEAETEKMIVQKLNRQHADSLASLVGTTFDQPSSSCKFFMNGEIASSFGFLCDNLYVQYYFELPEGWNVVHEENLSGSTYTCRSKSTTEGIVSHFGFPVCLELEADLKKSFDKGFGCPGIQLFIEVISIDRWGNGRGEGYGYATVPLSPGSYSVVIPTWKITPVSLTQRLWHFFIGGTSYLEDISSIRFPNSIKDPQLSKYGIKTESSGSITLKYHAAFQTGSDVTQEEYDYYLHSLSRRHKNTLS